MSLTTIRANIITQLEAVTPSIGNIYDFKRHVTTWEKYFSEFSKSGKIQAWEVTRTALDHGVEAVQDLAGTEALFFDRHFFTIFGYVSVDDVAESEKDFQDTIELIRIRFRQNNLLGGTVVRHSDLQVATIDHLSFGGVLVHYTEMTLETEERVGG